MTEQRKHQRFDLRLPCEILRPGRHEKHTGETRNVSSSGALLVSLRRMEIGEAIEYRITFPRTSEEDPEVRLHCVGKVLRQGPGAAFAATLERYEFVRNPA